MTTLLTVFALIGAVAIVAGLIAGAEYVDAMYTNKRVKRHEHSIQMDMMKQRFEYDEAKRSRRDAARLASLLETHQYHGDTCSHLAIWCTGTTTSKPKKKRKK